jgi:hypothetical protein
MTTHHELTATQAPNTNIEDVDKIEMQHVEVDAVKPDEVIFDYHADDTPETRKGWRRILKENPPQDFMEGVARMDQTVLDPKRVKKVKAHYSHG